MPAPPIAPPVTPPVTPPTTPPASGGGGGGGALGLESLLLGLLMMARRGRRSRAHQIRTR
jgi:immune inhibitor A